MQRTQGRLTAGRAEEELAGFVINPVDGCLLRSGCGVVAATVGASQGIDVDAATVGRERFADLSSTVTLGFEEEL